MKIVITGTTSAGKSTTLDILQSRGYNVIPEGALQIILEQQKLPNPILPSNDPEKFQDLILERQLALETNVKEGEFNFLDRSMVDSYGYANFYQVKYPSEIDTLAKGRYDKVFVLEPLPFYDNKFGFEDRKTQLEIDTILRESYAHFGYEYTLVPVMEPEARVDFILGKIK